MKNLPLAIGLLALFSLFALTFLARPIQDPDFFWHLKMGEWLWQHHSWPIPDPFAFTTPEVLDERQLFIVKGYWLSQLLYFLCYNLLGWSGIYGLRLLILAGFFWALGQNRQGDPWLWFGFSLISLVAIVDPYPMDRPHFFSFLMFAWLYLFLDRIWSGKQQVSRQQLCLVGFVMLAWGNLHGGVFLGQGLLLVSLFCGLAGLFRKEKSLVARNPWFWMLIGLGLLMGCLNPNLSRIFYALTQVADTSALMYASIEEYASVARAWGGIGRPLAINYLLFAVLAILSLIFSFRKSTLFSLMVVCGTGFYAAKHIRYVPFFVIACLPILVRGFEEVPLRRLARNIVAIGGLLFFVGFAWDERTNLSQLNAAGWVSNQDFPVVVADQLLATNVDGRMFNLYRWGGYLLWRLGPDRQVFVDGRAFDGRIIRDVLTAEMVSFGGGRMVWKEVFDRHHITYAVLPLYHGGEPYRLTQAMASDPGWQVAFSSGNAALLVRR